MAFRAYPMTHPKILNLTTPPLGSFAVKGPVFTDSGDQGVAVGAGHTGVGDRLVPVCLGLSWFWPSLVF